MATSETIATKKVTDLTENTSMSDSDLFMVGNAGTSTLRKLKWSNIIAAIKNKLGSAATYSVANNLTTTASSYVLDARQGKALSDKIGTLSSLGTSANGNVVDAVNEVNSAVDELNTNIGKITDSIIEVKMITFLTNASSSAIKTVDLPTGFTQSNSFVIGYRVGTSSSRIDTCIPTLSIYVSSGSICVYATDSSFMNKTINVFVGRFE
jgi:hypothetical protein